MKNQLNQLKYIATLNGLISLAILTILIILIIDGSGSGKANISLILKKHQGTDIDKIYLYIKNPFESKYLMLISGREKVEIKKSKNPKAFIHYSQAIGDVYENLAEKSNPTRKRKVLIVFDMIADIEANKKLSPIVTTLSLQGKKTQHFNCSCITILF